MKHYKDINDNLFGFAEGTTLPEGLTEITMEEVAAINLSKIPPLTEAEKIQAIEDGIDTLVDDTAKAKGYGTKTMSPTAACIAYAGYANPYQAEAIAFGQWKASIWPIVFQIQMDYEAAVLLDPATPEPTLESIIAALPVMVWP